MELENCNPPFRFKFQLLKLLNICRSYLSWSLVNTASVFHSVLDVYYCLLDKMNSMVKQWHTLKYVVNQSDFTVQTLRNVTEYLLLAKTINVAQVFLPSDVKDEIDKLNADLNAAADMLSQKTSQNSGKIRRVFKTM